MKIVVACDSFKNCLRSEEVASSIKQGIKKYNADFDVKTFITSDGGEGSVASYVEQCEGYYVEVETVDAYRKSLSTYYGVIDNGETAVVEVANIIGLTMTPLSQRRVMQTTSYGVGIVLKEIAKSNIKKVIICLGGSATNDAGVGVLEALGAKFYDSRYQLLQTNSGMLRKIKYIDLSNMDYLKNLEIIVASDVSNTLLGEKGCTYCFGKQKGILISKMAFVDECMAHYATVMYQNNHIDLKSIIGGGAAGGIGSALIGVLKAKWISGIQLLIEKCGIEKAISECDLVITGEGQSDYQTAFGKVPAGIVMTAQKYQKPTICISGALGKDYETLYALGFIGIVSIADRAMSFEQALHVAKEKLMQCAYTQIKMIDYFRKIHK